METLAAISKAITIREFEQNRTVPIETIRSILEAGRMTPSARNKQPWYFVAITDRGLLKSIGEIAQTGPYIADASFAVAVVTDPQNKWHEIDGTRAIQNMTIAAWDLGLGGSWVGSIDKEKAKELLNVPNELNILTIVPFGYPTKKYAGKKSRKPFGEVAFLNSFGGKL